MADLDRGQMGLVHIGIDPPVNKKLVWIELDATTGRVKAYKWYDELISDWRLFNIINVVDVLNSISTIDALSANKGRELKLLIDGLTNSLNTWILNFNNSLDLYQLLSEKNKPNGYLSLDENGQIPAEFQGNSPFNDRGNWDASSGSAPSATPANGDFWIVGVAGSTNVGGISTWTEGDWIRYINDSWSRIPSVNVQLIDSLTSQSTTKAATANQAYVLKGLIDTANTAITANGTAIGQMETDISNMDTVIQELITSLGNLQTDLSGKQPLEIVRTGTISGNTIEHADLAGLDLVDLEVHVGGLLLNMDGKVTKVTAEDQMTLDDDYTGFEYRFKYKQS